MPFNLGPWELMIVLLVVLIAFGAKRLPEVGAAMGKSIREFKRNISDVKESIDSPDSGRRSDREIDSDEYDDGEPKKLSE